MNGPTKDSYLKRAFIFAEDKDWVKAAEYCEKVLDIDPECAEAYFCKMLIDFKFPNVDALEQSCTPISVNPNFRKAIQFADEEQAKLWRDYSVKNIFNLTINFLKEKNYGGALPFIEKIRWNEEQILTLKDALVENELFAEAMKLLNTDNSKRFSSVEVFKISFIEDMFKKAEEFRNNKLYHTAYELYKSLEEYKDISQQIELCLIGIEEQKALREELAVIKARKTIATAKYHSVAIMNDGRAVSTKFMDKNRANRKIPHQTECMVYVKEPEWKTLVAIDCNQDHTVALRADGTVVATNAFSDRIIHYSRFDMEGNEEVEKDIIKRYYGGQCNVKGWKGIKAIAAGRYHTVGLKENGSVISTRYTGEAQFYYNQDNVSEWKDIIMITAGDDFSAGLTSDGKVVCTRNDPALEWKDIIYIFDHKNHIYGLRADGKVLRRGQIELKCDEEVIEIVKADSALGCVGLTKNFTLKAIFKVKRIQEELNAFDEVASIAGFNNLLILKKDGTVEALPDTSSDNIIDNGQCKVESWKNIAQPPKEKTFSELLENEKVRLKQFEEAKVAAAQAKKLELQQKKEEEQRKIAEAEAERKRIAEEKQRKKAMQEKYCKEGLCRHCGGTFKGLIFKVCTQCGHKKDY